MTYESKHIVEFTLIYNRFKGRVYNYVFRMTGDNDLSEDVVQNVFIKLFENMDTINNFNSISFWIFKTARNDLYKHFRRTKVIREKGEIIKETMINNAINDARELYELKEINTLVMNLLEEYPDEQKETYLLKESGGLSYSEIAEITDVEVKTVKSRLYEVRQKIIKQLVKVI
ncbi:MAG: RNA polymerase sigma factor [Ignavibacteriales bacterium]|nr:RNA polymerase sigma factor [Ignavibacteriales bacterium]